jgi:hypothetical protein
MDRNRGIYPPMPTSFTKLNNGWNAEPNGHDPHISVEGTNLVFEFLLNDLKFSKYQTAEKGFLRFSDCWRYRLGQTNDEGWYYGQCRFSHLAPAWGEFYEVHGDLLLDAVPNPDAFRIRGIQLKPFTLDWVTLGVSCSSSRHFIFYLRDQTFECDASAWEFSVKWRA